ncbi:MAG: ATP-binding protein [Spirochaetia bacterium]
METYTNLLKDVYFFQDLNDHELSIIARSCKRELIKAGEIIFREGSEAERFFIVLSGAVEVWKDYFDDQKDLLAVHGKGHLFGEMALIDELPRSATVIAREDTEVLYMVRGVFHKIVSENASIAQSIMRSVSSMVRKSNETFVEGLRKQNQELAKANKELHEAQEELLRAERLSTLGKFSSLILHDIRNPISVLNGYASMIILHGDGAEKTTEYAKKILAESNRLNRLANELLDYSRGEIRLNISVVDLHDFFAELQEYLDNRFSGSNIEATIKNTITQPVLFDRDRMMRVIMNLSENARKAMPKGGTFTLSAFDDNGKIVFQVSDTGIGMSEEVKLKIFEPFYSSSHAGGTGLGLLIVKSVIEAHDGSLSVESKEGSGTDIYLYLPKRA